MAVEKINEDDTLNQGRIKINKLIDSTPIRAQAWLYNSKKISFNYLGNGNVKVDLKGQGISVNGDYKRNFDNVDLTKLNNTSDAVVTANTIEGQSYQLILDTLKDELLIKPFWQTNPTDLVLVSNYYYAYYGGLLYESYYSDLSERIPINQKAQQVYAYFDNGEQMILEKLGSGITKFKLPKVGINIVGSTNLNITYDTIKNFLSAQNLINNFSETGDYIEFNSTNFMWAYDLKDQKLVMYNTNTYLYSWQIPLIICKWYSFIGGTLYESYISNLADDDIESSDIPPYYVEHVNSKILEINNIIANASFDDLTFAMIADTHWDSNDKHSPALLKEVLKRTKTPYLIHLGDLINEGENKEKMLNQLAETSRLFDSLNLDMPILFGNHDDNSNWSPELVENRKLTKKQVMKALTPNGGGGRLDQKLINPNCLSFTLDFSKNSPYKNLSDVYWRGFAFDSGSAAGDFYRVDRDFGNFVNFCKTEGEVVVFSHIISDNARLPGKIVQLGQLIDAINTKSQITLNDVLYDCTSCKSHVVCVFGGHDHKDQLFKTANGTPMIVVDCDAGRLTWNNTEHPYVKGTITEQSFNIVTIHYSKKQIELTRVGRGNNRIINYV